MLDPKKARELGVRIKMRNPIRINELIKSDRIDAVCVDDPRSVLDTLSEVLDGTQKQTYFAGRVYIVPKSLADNFVAKGWADETTEPVSS